MDIHSVNYLALNIDNVYKGVILDTQAKTNADRLETTSRWSCYI